MRLAILSATGTAHKRIIPAIRELGLCEIVAIHGRNEPALAALAREYAIPLCFVDADAMLTAVKPDFGYNASPPGLHREHIQLCLEHGTPALCEKPLCLSVADAEFISSLVGAGTTPVRIAHHLRHQPGVAAVRELIYGGKLGRLRRVSMQWGFWLDESASNAVWKLEPTMGGPNAFYDAGIHVIDLLIHLLPYPSRVAAVAGPSRFKNTMDDVSVLLSCGDVVAELNASQSMAFARNQLSLDFEDGSVAIPHAFGETAFTVMEITSRSGKSFERFEDVNLYAEEIRDFIQLLQGGRTVGTTTDDARRGMRVLEAITESYTNGTVVDLVPPGLLFA
jgi:predicted dehydrogenase